MAANGSEQLRRIAAQARQLGDGGIKRDAVRAVRTAAQPLPAAVKAAAARQLPQHGGLAARVSAERVTISVITGGNRAGVRLRQANHDARTTNSGYVRHPTFGDDPWQSQEIPDARGWWTDTLKSKSPQVAAKIHAQLTATLSTLGRL